MEHKDVLYRTDQTYQVDYGTYSAFQSPSRTDVSTMTSPVSILVYGRDPRLLETRRWVLEHSGARVWMATELSDFDQIAAGKSIDLVILCHSLSMEDCGRALALANTRWPQAQSLVLISEPSDCFPGFSDGVADAGRGPAFLLQTVAKLIGNEHAFAPHV
jgi:hypothetical protein